MIKFGAFFLLLIGFSANVRAQRWNDLHKEAIDLYNKKEYTAAIPVAERAIEAARQEFGEGHVNFLQSLNLSAYLYIYTSNPVKAEPALLAVADGWQKLKGETDPDYAKALYSLGAFYREQGQYYKAAPLLEKAVAIRKEVLGETNRDYIQTLSLLGSVYRLLEQFDKAEPVTRDYAICSYRAFGEDHPATRSAILQLATLYYEMGQYEKAEPLFLNLARNYEKNQTDSLPAYVSILEGLAKLYADLGQQEKAESYWGKALDNRKKFYGERSTGYVTTLNLFAGYYLKMGTLAQAEVLLKKALAITRELSGTESRDYGKSLNNLASLYNRQGKYDQSLELLQQADAIFLKTIGQDHPAYTQNLVNQAWVLLQAKDYDGSALLYNKALELTRKTAGENNAQYFRILANLGHLYTLAGETVKAEDFLQEALTLQEKNLGQNHPAYIQSLDLLYKLQVNTGQMDKAEASLILKNKLAILNLLNAFTTLSEQEKRNYLNNTVSLLETSNSFLYKNPRASEELYEHNFGLLLVLKSLSLADTRNMMDALRNSTNPQLRQRLLAWDSLNKLLAREYSLPLVNRRKDLNTLREQAETLEKELNVLSTEFRRQRESLNISRMEMEAGIKEKEAVIEFVRFRLFDKKWTDSIMYGAYIFTRAHPIPRFVPLFEEKQLQRLMDSAGNGAREMVNSFYRGFGLKNKKAGSLGPGLYQLVWAPLEPYLKGINSISYSPAGKLYSIAFQALQPDSQRMLIDKYELRQYITTREVAHRDATKTPSKPARIALFGNPLFSLDSAALSKQSGTESKGTKAVYIPADRGKENNSWTLLPGTGEEVKKIKELFDRNKIASISYTSANAREERLKEFHNRSPQILHIATHGFFLPEPTRRGNETNPGEDNNNSYTIADDPLLRSGLVLAGGNLAWNGKAPPEGVEDGIVTAYEISQLNLSQTELVVLSACETALGEVKGSEGVFGLQRAFKMAGVQKMIVSLWQVPDKETAELMSAFYTNWMKGKSIHDAFRQAQAEMRKKYPPFYWAAFVLVE